MKYIGTVGSVIVISLIGVVGVNAAQNGLVLVGGVKGDFGYDIKKYYDYDADVACYVTRGYREADAISCVKL